MTAHRLGLKASPKSGDYFFSFEVILILLKYLFYMWTVNKK